MNSGKEMRMMYDSYDTQLAKFAISAQMQVGYLLTKDEAFPNPNHDGAPTTPKMEVESAKEEISKYMLFVEKVKKQEKGKEEGGEELSYTALDLQILDKVYQAFREVLMILDDPKTTQEDIKKILLHQTPQLGHKPT